VQLHPTRSAVDLTVASILLIGLGLVTSQAAIVAWGGALIVGLQIARGVTLLSVAKVRAAGFEMLWRERRRSVRIARGEVVELQAEVRNRDSRAARYVHLRSVHSPLLELRIDPPLGEVPAGGRLSVTISVTSERVGRHGIHGLSLEVRGSPGLYEVPLTFSNPFGVEVMPRAYRTRTKPALGGRSRSRADMGGAGKRAGGNYDLREVREYQSGDPYKRIAWKASGRRARLMVREFDLEERDVIWLMLDASVELWSGVVGASPLDLAIDQVAAMAEHQLELGNRVGLCIVAARRLTWIKPETRPGHAAHIMEALAFHTGCYDSDRSTFDEADVAARVLEHLRPLEPQLVENVRSGNLDRVARRASPALRRAPFVVPPPFASTAREQVLRHYLASFGIDSPARLEPDRPKTDQQLLEAVKEVMLSKPHASLVYIWSPAPDPNVESLMNALRSLPRRRGQLRWIPMRLDTGFETSAGAERGAARARKLTRDAVQYAVAVRARVAQQSGEDALRKLGIRVEHPKTYARSIRQAALEPSHLDHNTDAKLDERAARASETESAR
jgi:uncharacterized protein (DUF58 family)